MLENSFFPSLEVRIIFHMPLSVCRVSLRGRLGLDVYAPSCTHSLLVGSLGIRRLKVLHSHKRHGRNALARRGLEAF